MNRQGGQIQRRTLSDLRDLAEAIRAIETGVSICGRNVYTDRAVVNTGWDDGRGGPISRLACGCVHEWFAETNDERGTRSVWTPALTLLIHLAWQAVDHAGAVAGVRAVLWIGRACWPYGHALVRRETSIRPVALGGVGSPTLNPGTAPRPPPALRPQLLSAERLLRASIFVDPPDDASRVWAIDLALRAGAVVIADGSRLDMTASRRLQLAAEAGRSGLLLLARPGRERRQLSAAATRWLVRPAPALTQARPDHGVLNPRWTVELIRCKGVHSSSALDHPREWTLELDRARGVVCVLPPMVDRPAAPARQAM